MVRGNDALYQASITYDSPAVVDGWNCHNNEKWFYYGPAGIVVNSLYEIDQETYYFDESGYRASGWVLADGYSRYFYEDGTMAKDTCLAGPDPIKILLNLR